ncbi:OOP family OmpA-OmpF porin [Shimia isoporae]|uniref:OOP family OmpA-OmpF porin n=1 Tax=Shimia isoporae TaxID=647720 RepID=A0A4R1NC68_9RHOB|nr:OmpA family protein [Shimia isoporae]TCL01233.1 OOP family OmpA-OmpF porin [Shimia isoporae]
MIRAATITFAVMVGLPVAAFEPVLPDGAQQIYAEAPEQRIYALPTGPYEGGAVPVDRVPGDVRRRSWRITSGFGGTNALASSFASQLLEQDFDILYSCDAAACGGFDFRFDIEVLLPPHMFVDLADYVFLAALKETSAGLEAVGVLVSRTAEAGMVQVTDVGPAKRVTQKRPKLRPVSATPIAPNVSAADVSTLQAEGHLTLGDLVFETGSSKLGTGPFASLEMLAAFLNEDDTRRVALVGHTDSVGGLDANTELSRKRAVSVKQRLEEAHNVSADQLEARGVGYLSPVASNLTEAGRSANRRVEAVLLNTE